MMVDYEDDELFDDSQPTIFVSEDEEDEEDPQGHAFIRGVEEAEQIIEKSSDEDDYL